MAIYTSLIFRDKRSQRMLSVILLLILTTVGLDFSFSKFHNSAFFISESLLFSSSFWVLFLPLLFIQLNCLEKTKRPTLHALTITAISLAHLFLYPALVWVLSKTTYNHTFSYWQTFNYGLNTYFIVILISYISAFFITMLTNKRTINITEKGLPSTQSCLTSIVISDNNNKKLMLAIEEISHFSAGSPYILINYQSKTYLHTGTLKFLETQLNSSRFVRIHKSHIVNLQKVASYQSRQNGDYDLALADGTVLRLSRNYAKNFKLKFHQLNRLSIK